MQRNTVLFTGADAHDIFNIGDKDPAYADVVGVQHLLCGFDDLPDGYLADYDALLNLGLQRDLNRRAR